MGRVRKELFQQLRQPLKGDKEHEGRERMWASQLAAGNMKSKSDNSFTGKKAEQIIKMMCQ